MQEPGGDLDAFVRWVRNALPWAFWGSAGGVLALLAMDRRPTFWLALSVLLRSLLVGTVTGLLLTDYDFALGGRIAAVTFAAFSSDAVLAVAKGWADQARRHPGKVLGWLTKRRGGSP